MFGAIRNDLVFTAASQFLIGAAFELGKAGIGEDALDGSRGEVDAFLGQSLVDIGGGEIFFSQVDDQALDVGGSPSLSGALGYWGEKIEFS